jgi:pentatricopeptide repeat protein
MLKITDKKEYIKFLFDTARTMYTECQFESAIRFYEKVLTYEDEFDVKQIIRIYNALMRSYAEEGRFEDVDRIFKKISYLDFSKIPLDKVFVSFYELAISYYRRGEFHTAMKIVDNAMKGYDDGEIGKIKKLKAECIDIICKLLLLKTDILFSINNLPTCMKYVELLEKLDTEKKLFSYVEFFKGRTAANQGRILDSLKSYRALLNYERRGKKKINGTIASQVYVHIALLFFQMGKFAKSKKYFYKYLTHTSNGRSNVSNMLLSWLIARYNFQEGDFREADSMFTKLLGATSSHRTKAISLLTKISLSNLHLTSNNLEEAKIALDTSYKYIHGTEENIHQKKLEVEWAKYFLAEGNYTKALEIVEKSLDGFDALNRNDDLCKLYCVAARINIIRKEYVKAFEIILRMEEVAKKNFMKLDLLDAKLLKIIVCKALRKEHLLAEELEEAKKLISKKIGGIAYMVILSKIQGHIQDHSVFLRKNQDLIVKYYLKGLGVFHSEDEDHDIILDYKRKTIFEKSVGEIYMGNKGLLLRILLTLIEKKGQVIAKEELFEKVWQDLYDPIKHDNLIYININRLRKLIEPDAKKNRYILNMAGGYMFNDAVSFYIKSVNMEDSLSKRQTEILDFIRKNKRITIREYKERFGISKSSAIRDLKRLKELNLISEERAGNKAVYTTLESFN